MTNPENLISQFKKFEFEGCEEWQTYLKRLEPTPEGAVLERRQRKWYSQNIDTNFKPEMMEPKKAPEPKPASHPARETYIPPTTSSTKPAIQIESDATFTPIFGAGIISLLLWSLPWIGRISIPIPFVGVNLTFFEVAVSFIFRSAFVLSGGFNWREMSIDAFKNSPILCSPHWLATMLEIMVGFSKQWTMILIPPVIHIAEVAYADNQSIMKDLSGKFEGYLKERPIIISTLLASTGNSEMPPDMFLSQMTAGLLTGASRLMKVMRCQVASMNSILFALMTIVGLFRMQFFNISQFIIYSYAMKMRFLTMYEARSCYHEIFMKARGYMPESIIVYYDMVGGYIHQYASM